jgi:hypothetical protein
MLSQSTPFKDEEPASRLWRFEYDQLLDQGTATVKLFLGAAKARHARRTRGWFAIVSLAGGLLFLTLSLADRVWKQAPQGHYAPAVAGDSQPG